MLKGTLIHPELLSILGRCGHGSQVLIADANFPFHNKRGPRAEVVYLNLGPGLVTATDVLRHLLTAVNVEQACVMQPEDGSQPEIFGEFQALLGDVPVQPVERAAFYAACQAPETCLVVATGEQRLFGNVLLSLGVVMDA